MNGSDRSAHRRRSHFPWLPPRRTSVSAGAEFGCASEEGASQEGTGEEGACQEASSQEAGAEEARSQEARRGVLMAEPLEELIERAESQPDDRYPLLIEIHDALREALAETDGDAAATGR